MRFSTIISLGLTFFITGITAIAFPATSSDDCISCGDLITSTGSCGYNMISSDASTEPTTSQVSCMCQVDGFQSQYSDCLSCMVSMGQYTSDEASEYTSMIAAGCDQVTGGAECLAARKGKIVAGVLAVGLGVYAM